MIGSPAERDDWGEGRHRHLTARAHMLLNAKCGERVALGGHGDSSTAKGPLAGGDLAKANQNVPLGTPWI